MKYKADIYFNSDHSYISKTVNENELSNLLKDCKLDFNSDLVDYDNGEKVYYGFDKFIILYPISAI